MLKEIGRRKQINKAKKVQKAIRAKANETRAKNLSWFFKTGKGEYGEGDKFVGLITAQVAEVIKEFQDLSLPEIKKLLQSQWHEDRSVALGVLKKQFEKTDDKEKTKIAKFYLANKSRINNWDLVDISAPRILGEYLFNHPKEKKILFKLVKSKILWNRRIAVLASAYFIGQNKFQETLSLIKLLLNDKEDLMHKACGWMLREIWKRDAKTAEKFLNQYLKVMPRTMLRYAIERMPETRRKSFLEK